MTQSAALSVLPWGLNVACTNMAGWLGDQAIHQHGVDRTLTRKVMQGVASLGPAACLLALSADQGEPPLPPSQTSSALSGNGNSIPQCVCASQGADTASQCPN